MDISKTPLDQCSQSNLSLQVFVYSCLSFDDMISCNCVMERPDPMCAHPQRSFAPIELWRWMARQHKMAQRSVILLALVFFLTITHAGQTSSIMGLGTFSNFRFTEEHQYGAAVQLWRDGDILFGLFSYSQGLIGDTPAGMLEKVTFDPKTGRISFIARLTMGIHGCKLHNNVPSQDILNFDGVLSEFSLSGTLVHADNLHQELDQKKEDVVLKMSDEWVITQYQSREQWEAAMKNILKFRGPKW